MKILSRPGMPSETDIPAPLEVRRAAAEIIRAGRYDEEELEDALVLIGGYLWETWDEEEDEDENDDLSPPELEQRLRTLQSDLARAADGFIGRQLPAGDAGTLDLIRYHPSSGELTIYELKAREIQVSDLAQVESYRVALEEFDPDDLARLLVNNSGRKGISRVWEPEELRGMLDYRDDEVIDNEALLENGDPDYDPDLRRISCAVVGNGYKARVSRLAKSMGIELIHIPDLITTALEELSKAEPYVAKEEETKQALGR